MILDHGGYVLGGTCQDQVRVVALNAQEKECNRGLFEHDRAANDSVKDTFASGFMQDSAARVCLKRDIGGSSHSASSTSPKCHSRRRVHDASSSASSSVDLFRRSLFAMSLDLLQPHPFVRLVPRAPVASVVLQQPNGCTCLQLKNSSIFWHQR